MVVFGLIEHNHFASISAMGYLEFLKSLPEEDLHLYAERVGTTVKYLQIQLIPRKRVPRPDLMERLADATPEVSRIDVLRHFYPEMFAGGKDLEDAA